MESNKATRQFTDINLAAALASSGETLIDTEYGNGRVHFVFNDSPTLKKAVRNWWSGKLTVSAPRYAEFLNRFKDLVFSIKRSGKRNS